MSGCQFPGAPIYELVMQLKRETESLQNGIYKEHDFQGMPGLIEVRDLIFGTPALNCKPVCAPKTQLGMN